MLDDPGIALWVGIFIATSLFVLFPPLFRIIHWTIWLVSPLGLYAAARHEAGHALVGCVLGKMPKTAKLYIFPRTGIAGGVSFDVPKTMRCVDHAFCSMVTLMTIDLAGVIAERRWNSGPLLKRFETQSDWTKALRTAICCSAIHSDQLIIEKIIEELKQSFLEDRWKTAIRQTAWQLMRSPFRGMSTSEIMEIMEQNRLELPGITRLIYRDREEAA